MKQYVALFEHFEEEFDDFYSKPDPKSDQTFHTVANELIELANQYTDQESPIEMYSDKYSTPTRVRDLQSDLIAHINDTMGENMAEDFMMASDDLLKSYGVMESKKKLDQDGDGDSDFIDAKIAKYKKGGIAKEPAIKKAKLFAKTNNIPDNGISKTSSKALNLEKPTGKKINMRPRQTKNPR
jgi:hypothetical protein